MKNKVKLMVGILLAFGCIALGSSSCYDASKVPPCTGYEQWPDPCAAALRDAGRG